MLLLLISLYKSYPENEDIVGGIHSYIFSSKKVYYTRGDLIWTRKRNRIHKKRQLTTNGFLPVKAARLIYPNAETVLAARMQIKSASFTYFLDGNPIGQKWAVAKFLFYDKMCIYPTTLPAGDFLE